MRLRHSDHGRCYVCDDRCQSREKREQNTVRLDEREWTYLNSLISYEMIDTEIYGEYEHAVSTGRVQP